MIDLTIPIEGLDTEELLAEWRWLVPRDLKPIHLSKFGNWFFVSDQGAVHLLCLIEGELKQIAVSVQEFARVKDLEDNRAEWYLDGFVEQCHAQGMELGPGECFGWLRHPALGGPFEITNIEKVSLGDYQRRVGQQFRQLRGLEPGATVQAGSG
ncbi:MAG: DUF1851 domain-containing protein [Deltaproteobacteria bacterium]|nr:DUF1851 domain-containing protein [Deltaproteobacteria bacterium]